MFGMYSKKLNVFFEQNPDTAYQAAIESALAFYNCLRNKILDNELLEEIQREQESALQMLEVQFSWTKTRLVEEAQRKQEEEKEKELIKAFKKKTTGSKKKVKKEV